MPAKPRLSASFALAATAFAPIFTFATVRDAGAEDVVFAPEWQNGKRYIFVQEMGGGTKMKIGDLDMEQKMDSEFVLGITVSPAEEGGQTLSWGYDSVKMDMEMMGQKMSFDSASPESGNPMIGPVFKSLTDLKVSGVLGKDGSLKNVKVEGEGADNPMLQNFGLGKESLAQMVEGLSGNHFPEKAVSEGESWTHSQPFPVPQGEPINIETTYTYIGMGKPEGVEGELPKVTYTAKMAEGATIEAQGVSMTIASMDMSGVLYYDGSKKSVVLTTGNVEMVMKMGNGEETMEIPAKQTVTMTLKDIVDAE